MCKPILLFLSIIYLIPYVVLGQEVNADITIDDYQWLDNETNPIDLSATFPDVSLTKWYTPLPVFFQGWKSTPREAIVDYEWNFGDDSPLYHGMNAGHVYETPGIYTATLTTTDTLGHTDADTVIIEVLERKGNIYYIDSELGDDSYNGLSQTHTGGSAGPWKTANKAFAEMASEQYEPGDQILFRRGQTFDLSISEISPGAWPSWGYMFGAYGTGAKPIIQYSGENNAIIIHQYAIGLAHISFVDLDFRFDDYAGHKAGTFFFAQGGGTRNILFLRVDALDLYSDLFVIGQHLEREISSGTFLVNSSIENTYINPDTSSTMFAVWGSRVVLLNNNFDLSGNHIGYTAIDKGVITGNRFSRPAFGRTALRICGFQEEGEDWNQELTSNNVQISDNSFFGWIDPETEGRAHNGGGDRYNYLLVQLAPNGPWNQIIRDITFERNIITNSERSISVGAAENITLRNNIIVSDNTSSPSYFIGIVDANKPTKNVKITGNTFVARNAQYSGNPYEMSGMINIYDNTTQVSHPFSYSNHEEIKIYNNIFFSYGDSSFTRFMLIENIDEVLPQLITNNNLYYVSESGSFDKGQFFQIGSAPDGTAEYLTFQQWQNHNDNLSVFADPQFIDLFGPDELFSGYGFDADLRLEETSPARDQGNLDLTNTYFDFNQLRRMENDDAIDIGAFEYGSETSITFQQENFIADKEGLLHNYPNPFTNSTTITFTIPTNQSNQRVFLEIYGLEGKKIETLLNEHRSSGNYQIEYNFPLKPGIYIIKLQINNNLITTKKILKY